MGLVIATEPVVEPVSSADLIAFLRLDDTYDSETLLLLEKAARKAIEAAQNRQMITTAFEWSLDNWPCEWSFDLPTGPVQSVEAIKYYDASGVQQTMSASNYQVDITGVLGTITPAASFVWPILEYEKKNAITIEFTAGYGDTAASVPETTRMAIIALVAHWHENRVPVITGAAATDIPMHVQWMMAPDSVPLAY